jgi:hypothetical protein
LPLFIEEQHCDGDDRFGHRGNAVDGVFAQRLTPFKGLVAIEAGLYELAVAGNHDTDPGIMTSINFFLHRVIKAVQALSRESDRRRTSEWQRNSFDIEIVPLLDYVIWAKK